MLIFSVFFLVFFCNISLRRPTCLNQPLRQSKAALFSIFCFISLSGVKPAHDQPPPRLYFLIYPHHFLVLTPKVFGSPVCSDTRSTVSSRHLSTSVQSPISTCRPHLPSPVPRSRLLVFHLWPRRSSQTAMCVCVCLCGFYRRSPPGQDLRHCAWVAIISRTHVLVYSHMCIQQQRERKKILAGVLPWGFADLLREDWPERSHVIMSWFCLNLPHTLRRQHDYAIFRSHVCAAMFRCECQHLQQLTCKRND